jgi:acyl dehydratase
MTENLPLIQSLSLPITSQLLVAYAGATWDFHRYHYDSEFVRERLDIDKPFVDGQMFGAIIAKHLIHNLGNDARILSMKLRYLSMVSIGESVNFEFKTINSRLAKTNTILKLLINVTVEEREILQPIEVEVMI